MWYGMENVIIIHFLARLAAHQTGAKKISALIPIVSCGTLYSLT